MHSRVLHHASIALLAAAGAGGVCAQSPPDVFHGKDDWLYLSYETPRPELAGNVRRSVALIASFHRLLARNGVALAVVLVPSKIEMHAEHLPDGYVASAYASAYHQRLQESLAKAGVDVIDVRHTLRQGALASPDDPVFFRLDTHWTPTGAALAATAVAQGIAAQPRLKAALDAVPREAYRMSWAKEREEEREYRNMLALLPAGAPAFAPERVLRFTVEKTSRGPDLLGPGAATHIALAGSSFSGEWTGFPDALRHALQRDVYNFSINSDVGPWIVMRAYLRDDAFQVQPPALVVWEMPERTLAWPPSFAARQARHQVDDVEWLLQVAALAERRCEPAGIDAKVSPTRERTTESDFVEIAFDKPVDRRSYLSARIVTMGSREIAVETYRRSQRVRRFTVEAAGDDQAHAFRTPLEASAQGVQKIRLFPGNTHAFRLAQVEVCRYPDDLARLTAR